MKANNSLTLFSLRDFLKQQTQPVFMWQLTQAFGCAPETIMPLLNRWVQKGSIVTELRSPCSGCKQHCNTCQLTSYFWQ